MNAIEFVKKFGLGKGFAVIDNWKRFSQLEKPTHFDSDLDIFIHKNDFNFLDESDVCVVELKELVNSFDLVESYGGLKACNEKLYMLHELTEDPAPIREAIELVEKCNASD